MNITQITYKYPPAYSGYGKQLYSINGHIQRTYQDIAFTIFTGFNDSYECNNIKIKNLIPSKLISKQFPKAFHFYLYTIFVFIRVLFLKKESQFIHCIKAGPEAVAAIIAAKLTNRTIIVKVAQNEIRECLEDNSFLLKRIARYFRLKILREADAIIAISSQIEKELITAKFEKNKILKIGNGVDVTRFIEVELPESKELFRNELNIPSKNIVGLFVGSIISRKGVFDLLEALKFSSYL